ncbi:MAG: PaaI family thioesterase [Gammaproteobacteria bacterium]|nr:PaaI family thioesterase [Gammaproteobacteria bacterium]
MLDLDHIRTLFDQGSPHTSALGIRLQELKRGYSVVMIEPSERHIGLPESGAIHGGILSTLIDSACGIAVLSMLERSVSIATLDLSLHHIKPSTGSAPIYASATCCKLTRSMAFLRSEVYQQSADNLLAHGGTTFMLGANHTKLDLQKQTKPL